MLHHFHAPGSRSPDSVESDPGQRAEDKGEGGKHFARQWQSIAENRDRPDDNCANDNGLRQRYDRGDSKQGATAGVIADCF